MSKREEQRLAKLVKKNTAKASNKKTDRAAQYDSTLRQRSPDEDPETSRFFKEMKKREF
jgi:hypothetical protein